jgi:hypothetical protein
MAENTDIPIDNRIVQANKPYSQFEPLSKDDFVRYASELWAVGATESTYTPGVTTTEKIVTGAIIKFTPLDPPEKENPGWKVLEKLWEILPKEYLRAQVTENSDGTKTIKNNALTAINLNPYLEVLKTKDLSEEQKTVVNVIQNGNTALLNDPVVQQQVGLVPQTTTDQGALAGQGMQIGDFQNAGGTTPGSEPVTQSNQQELFQQALSSGTTRTIDDMIKQITTSGGNYEFNLEGFSIPANGGGAFNRVGKQSWSPAKAKSYPWQLSAQQLEDLQGSLAEAGYYDKAGGPIETIGKMDAATGLAWGALLADSITYGLAPHDMLRQATVNTKNAKFGTMYGVQRMDESQIYLVAKQLGTEVIGRGLDANELAALTRNIRLWENEIAQAPWKTQDPETTALNLQYKTEEYLRTRFESDALTQSVLTALEPYGKAFR